MHGGGDGRVGREGLGFGRNRLDEWGIRELSSRDVTAGTGIKDLKYFVTTI